MQFEKFTLNVPRTVSLVQLCARLCRVFESIGLLTDATAAQFLPNTPQTTKQRIHNRWLWLTGTVVMFAGKSSTLCCSVGVSFSVPVQKVKEHRWQFSLCNLRTTVDLAIFLIRNSLQHSSMTLVVSPSAVCADRTQTLFKKCAHSSTWSNCQYAVCLRVGARQRIPPD